MGDLGVSHVWAVASLSYATPVTVNVTGAVTNLGDFPTILVGAPVTGSSTYDDAAAASQRDP